MPVDFKQNYFALFGMPEQFALDAVKLDSCYRSLQSEVHPDKFAHLPLQERRLSLQWATHVNEAYQTLKQPVSRAQYLLQLRGVDVADKTHTPLAADFLIQQMAWREAIADAAGSAPALESLMTQLQQEHQHLLTQLARALDDHDNAAPAAELVHKLRFYEKLDEALADQLAELDDA